MSLATIGMFAAILLISLGITAWAGRRTRTTAEFYAAGKGLTAAQNGFALAGDWCSAAAFLGLPDSPRSTAWTARSMPSARWSRSAPCCC